MDRMTEHSQPKMRRMKPRLTKFGGLVGGLALILLVALVTTLVIKSQPLQQVDSGKYQVVYLTNGQAYFGKLQNTTGDYLIMKSPYIAQSVDTTDKTTASGTSATQTTILKVTDQVYGPENSIAIKSSQVSFWQNLRDDSKVSQAIKAKE